MSPSIKLNIFRYLPEHSAVLTKKPDRLRPFVLLLVKSLQLVAHCSGYLQEPSQPCAVSHTAACKELVPEGSILIWMREVAPLL